MRYVIVLGGESGMMGYQPHSNDKIVACDSGYDHAIALGLTPSLLIGDMDSIQTPKTALTSLVFDFRKDDTDCMLAIKKGLEEGYKHFVLLCGFGGRRSDHFFANLQGMHYLLQRGATVEMCGKEEWCTIIHNDSLVLERKDGFSLSVFAFHDTAFGVTLQGVSYPLHDATVTTDFPIGVSNFIVEDYAKITVKKGTLLILRSPMEEPH